jgi:hypothetical protein
MIFNYLLIILNNIFKKEKELFRVSLYLISLLIIGGLLSFLVSN